MKHTLIKILATAGLLTLWAAIMPAQASDYPSKPITVIVPFSPGGGTDVITRVVAQKLSERLGQPVLVENRAGAGGNIGAELAARAKPDGYTLLAAAIVAHAINMTLQRDNIRYDIEKDFAPISLLGAMPLTMVVNKSFPAKTFSEFIDYAKKHPGEVTFASAGTGTTQHLAGEMFQLMTGTKMLHVGYKGSGPAMTDVIAGQVGVTFETGPVVVPHIKSGKLRPLFIARKERSAALPDVASADEVALPKFEVATLYGFVAPAGTPAPVIERINKEVAKILKLSDVKEKFSQQGVEPVHSTPPETAQRIHDEVVRWAKVIKEANVTSQ